MSLLETREFSVSIAGLQVCRELALDIEKTERWAILGRNGVGKTTLLKAFAGLHQQDAGTVRIAGEALDHLHKRTLARRLGVVFQEASTIFAGTVLETALIGRHPYVDPWRWEDQDDIALARTALEAVELGGLEQRSIATLSGGERQRLAIATLLTQDPALGLLDEPSNHLDPYHQVRVMNLLCGRTRPGSGRAVIMVLHDVNLAVRFCSHALLLFGDGAFEHGPVADVLNAEHLQRLYGHPVISANTAHGRYYFPA